MPSPRFLPAASRLVAIGLCLASASGVHAQQIFITSDTTINSDLSGNDIFIGKDNLTSFKTLPDHITVNITDGANTSYYGTQGTLAPDGRYYNGINAFGNDTINLNGGTPYNVFGYETSAINVSGGNAHGVTGGNNATVNVTGGAIYIASVYQSATCNVSGGTIGLLVTRSTVPLIITGGTVTGGVDAQSSSTINISGGALSYVAAYNTSTINMSAGSTNVAGSLDTGTTNITGGTFTTCAVSEGTGILNFSGGTVTGYIYSLQNGVSNVSGGYFTYILGGNSGITNLTGGTITGNLATAFDNSILNVYGTDLNYSLIGTGSDSSGVYTDYLLSGTLQGGQSIGGVTFRDRDGGLSIGDPTLGSANTGNLRFFSTKSQSVPEPGTLALLGLALPLIGVTGKRRLIF